MESRECCAIVVQSIARTASGLDPEPVGRRGEVRLLVEEPCQRRRRTSTIVATTMTTISPPTAIAPPTDVPNGSLPEGAVDSDGAGVGKALRSDPSWDRLR